MRASLWGALLAAGLIIVTCESTKAQNTPYEVGVVGAINGQRSLSPSEQGEGFFTNPGIEHYYFGYLTNGVQSLSVFVEHVAETRERFQDWSYFPGSPFPARTSEQLYMTTLGLETYRTLFSESGFRLAAGIGLGYGLGNAEISVTNLKTNQTSDNKSCSGWAGVIWTANLRARYTVYAQGRYDVGIIAIARYWGFPSVGPYGSCTDAYNGPSTTVLNELGYLAGVSVGF